MSALFGNKPSVPPLATTSIDQGQQAAIAANKNAMPGASELAGMTEQEIMSLMRDVMPGFDQMRTQAGGNINDLLQGKVPGDVSNAITNNAAAKALSGGYAGSGMHGDLVARDLGLTSLNLMDKGLSSAESWMAASERLMSPAMANFESMFVTPMQEYSTTNEQNLQQFQRSWMKNQISAMPDPTVRGIQDTAMQLLGRNGTPPTGSQFSSLQSPGTRSASTGGVDGSNGWQSADPGQYYNNRNSDLPPEWSDDLEGGMDAGAGVSGGMDMPSIDVSGFA